MSAKILDGKKLANEIKSRLSEEVEEILTNQGRAPSLAAILVGQDPASSIYVNRKRKACEKVGITSKSYDLEDTVSEDELLNLIDKLNNADDIDGILVQLPLPKHINTQKIIESISPKKDIDGFHAQNMGKLAQGNPSLRPCTPFGIIKMLETIDINLRGLKACVVGSSNIVGKPMALELINKGCTVTVCNSATKNLPKELSDSDLVVVAIGNPNFIKAQWLKEGAIAIDVGINRLEDGSITGDIEFDEAAKKASYITPVPGGVGPLTVATLLENTLAAYKAHKNIS